MPNLAKSAAKISHVRAVPTDLHDNHYRIFVVSSLKNACQPQHLLGGGAMMEKKQTRSERIFANEQDGDDVVAISRLMSLGLLLTCACT